MGSRATRSMSNRISGTIKLRLARRRVTRRGQRIRSRWPTTSRRSKPANSERENRALNRDTTVNGGGGAVGAAAGATGTVTAKRPRQRRYRARRR